MMAAKTTVTSENLLAAGWSGAPRVGEFCESVIDDSVLRIALSGRRKDDLRAARGGGPDAYVPERRLHRRAHAKIRRRGCRDRPRQIRHADLHRVADRSNRD